MKKLRDIINNNYFPYLFVASLYFIKLLFEKFKTTESYSAWSPKLTAGITYILVPVIIHCLLAFLIIFFIRFRHDKPLEEWQEEKKGAGTLLKWFFKPFIVTFAIVYYGFFVFLALQVFSWMEFVIFFGTMLAAQTIRTIYKFRKEAVEAGA